MNPFFPEIKSLNTCSIPSEKPENPFLSARSYQINFFKLLIELIDYKCKLNKELVIEKIEQKRKDFQTAFFSENFMQAASTLERLILMSITPTLSSYLIESQKNKATGEENYFITLIKEVLDESGLYGISLNTTELMIHLLQVSCEKGTLLTVGRKFLRILTPEKMSSLKIDRTQLFKNGFFTLKNPSYNALRGCYEFFNKHMENEKDALAILSFLLTKMGSKEFYHDLSTMWLPQITKKRIAQDATSFICELIEHNQTHRSVLSALFENLQVEAFDFTKIAKKLLAVYNNDLSIIGEILGARVDLLTEVKIGALTLPHFYSEQDKSLRKEVINSVKAAQKSFHNIDLYSLILELKEIESKAAQNLSPIEKDELCTDRIDHFLNRLILKKISKEESAQLVKEFLSHMQEQRAFSQFYIDYLLQKAQSLFRNHQLGPLWVVLIMMKKLVMRQVYDTNDPNGYYTKL